MDDLQNLRSEMRSKFLALFKSSASEEKFIEFIRLSLQQQGSNKFDIKALEVVLDLTLAVVDQYGCAKFNYDKQPVPQLDASNNSGSAAAGRDDGHNPGGTLLEEPPIANSSGVSPRLAPELVSYDADDEDFDDTFIFPCHLVYDNCHPELLSDYHREHLTPSRTSTQIVKLPKVCEFVIESMFKNLLSYIYNPKPLEFESSASSDVFSAAQDHVSHSESIPPGRKDFAEPEDDNLNLTSYLNMAVNLVKKLNKACVNERRNCKILSRTRMLNILMQNLILLIGEIPDKQHIYLEPLLKFSFTLADYKIQGTHLKQLFTIIKNENTDLKTVLKNFEQILTHHSKILRNIQPSKSINFPTASKTPEEIEYDHYVANSWHWRLRSKVIEYKRKRSRTDSQSQELESKAAAIMSQQLALADISNQHDIQESQSATGNKSAPKAAGQEPDGARRNSVIPATSNRITSSWLECSLMTPLSNIMPLTHDNELKFCCSMWISICGDLLVIEGTKSRQHRRTDASGNGDHFNIDWSQLDGHWLRLTSRRRLVRRHKNKVVVRPRPRKRRLSAKIRNRQAFDKEDEEREEIEEKVRRSEAELTQMSHNGRGRFRLFHSSLSRQTRSSAIKKQRDSILKKTKIDDQKTPKRFQGLSESTPPREYLGRRARDNSQELLIHLVSFAIDSLTIEIWLNVKSMTFCARACRVTREGQTNLLDQVTFPSHLESNGNWSNLMFCLEEQNKNSSEKVMNFKVIVNGVHKEKEKLVYSAHKSPLTNFALLIGCERSTFGYVWKLSQVNIYKSIPDKSMPIYLLGKGPDFWSFTNFRQPSLLPLPDVSQRYAKVVMSPKALMRYSLIDEEQALNWLTQNIMISYVAHQPDHFMDYSPSLSSASLINPLPADYEFSNSAERFIQAKTLDFSRSMRFNQNVGFGSALVEAGGVESVLICFAEVVRRSHETAPVHALAFSVLLKMAQTNLYHLNKFLDELNGLKLIEFILAHPNCKVSRQMLESYLDFCLMKQGERHLIKSPKLIFNLMTSWRAWHKDLKVAKLLYKRLIKLLQPPEASRKINNRQQQDEHKLQTFYTNHNFRMMSQAGGIDILMDVLRESLVAVESENSIRINHELVELIVNLISLLIKHPPGLDVMLDIMEFLLFLHPDPKAYVEVSANKISFLHQIKPLEVDAEIMFDEVVPSRVRTPSTRTSQSSLRSSDEDMDQYGAAVRRDGARSINRLKQSKQVVSGQSSQDDLFTTLENRISDQCSRNLAEIIEEFSESQRLASNEDVRYAWFQHRFNDGYAADANQIFRPYQQRELEPRCSNRNFAIANIADMLASIVKLASTDPMKILSEALQKPIIDPRKLVILANNESSLVREKVLRLFLYCIRACYSLNLKSVLASFEQETKSENYRICTPIHLMARQLLKHPATIRMVQLCYGIIMGVDDFETVDTVCLEFDIEPINNHLQLNTLVLLMHLLTQLRLTQDIVPGLKFIHAYLRQLLQLGEVTTVGFMIESSLIDCLMNLYFNYVENVIAQARDLKRHRTTAAAAAESGSEGKSNNQKNGSVQGDQENQCDQVADEIDRLLLFVVQFYIQNSSSVRLTKSVEDLLMYLELLNTYLPDKYHYILRDRKAKILITLLRYCRHYEESARQRAYGGKMEYYLKSFFKNNDLNRFSNNLPECELANMFDRSSDLKVLAAFDSQDDSSGSSDSGEEDDLSGPTQEGRNGSLQSNGSSDRGAANDQRALSVGSIGSSLDENCARVPPSDSRLISEADVVERFRATFEFVLTFVVTRGANIIPSPLERSFILRSLQILANYLIGNQHAKNGKARHRTHWTLMLPKLEALFKGSFSRLVLYLLSPCEAMNIDERKYYAHQILGTFRIDQLLNMLVEDSSRSHHKVLLAFAKELVEHSATSQAPSSDGNGTASEMDDVYDDDDDDVEEDELVDETEIKLRQLIRGLEFEVGEEVSGNQSRLSSYVYGKRLRPTLEDNDGRLTKLDAKYRDIWLVDLHQALEDYRERLLCLKMELKSSSSSSSSPSSSSNQATVSAKVRSSSMDKLTSPTLDDTAANRLIDEAINITKDVVNDKHEQRKAHLEDVKQGKVYNYHIRQQWLSLIIGHTHERAIWYLEDYYPSSWELNPVEGPSRTRRRLRPCKLALEARFLRGGRRRRRRAALNDCLDSAASSPSASRNSRLDDDLNADDWYYQYSPHPLCSLVINNEQHVGSHELRIRMFTTDKIHFNCDCSIIRPNEVCVGEVSIASWCIHFIGEQSDGYQRRLNDNQRRDRAGIRPMSARRLGRHLIANGGGSGGGGGSSNSCRPPKNQDTANTYEGEDSPFDEQDTKASLNSGSRRPCVASTVVEDLWFDEIVEIWDRRYQLQDVGLEIFLTNNMTYLMSFRNNHDREEFKQHLIREQHKMINLQRFNLTTSLNRLTLLWREGKLTNFDYLTCLNKLSGRSFNDLMQYPVFPFVLSNYMSEHLDLTAQENYRELSRPMAIQKVERETNFRNNYQMSQSSSLSIGGALGLSKPYHYGNHYSNSATVLHFLVRLPPFTQMLIQYQDNNFDQPDRTFHSVANTWQLITRDSNTDFKELIPEFFFLPEMFTNIEALELGRKQNNQLVNDVRLPVWCPNSDARLFTLIHRQALESAYVSENLHHWIDLIFGYKQTGKAAEEAVNVFHPATYYGGVNLKAGREPTSGSGSAGSNSLSAINLTIATQSARSVAHGSDYIANGTDAPAPNQLAARTDLSPLGRLHQADIERSALETMIKTYGQMPRQLFSQPMKQRKDSTFVPQINEVQLERHQEKMMAIENGNGSGKKLLASGNAKKLEPIRQVKGLRWGDYVGSPDEKEVIAVRHKRIILEEPPSYRAKGSKSRKGLLGGGGGGGKQSGDDKGPKLLSKRSDKFHFCLLTNGDVAILRNNTSLMLDYRADRKSSGTTTYQLSAPSARYSRRAGLSRVSRMNLFSNMIISRQQFSFLEPIYSPANQLNTFASTDGASTLASLTGTSQRVKFSLDSLNLVSWFYLDGTIRVKHPATSNLKPSIPLVQANTIVDTMSTCASVPELNLLLVGYKSGSICAHIVSTSYETAPLPRYIPTISIGASRAAAAALSASAAAPSAVHSLHTTSTHGIDVSLLGPGRVTGKPITGEPYSAITLAGKTLQSVRSMNKTTRWLYCHNKRVNCIKINVSFGIVVTGSDDGTSVIWDLNSLTYVRTIDYKISSLRLRNSDNESQDERTTSTSTSTTAAAAATAASPHGLSADNYSWTYGRARKEKVYDYLCNCHCATPTGSHHAANVQPNSKGAGQTDCGETDCGEERHLNRSINDFSCMVMDMVQQCCICGSGISLIAISDTLGDVVTVKSISNRMAMASGENESGRANGRLTSTPSGQSISALSSTTTTSSSSASSDSNSTTSIIYIHTINGFLVNFVNCHSQVTAVAYSHAPEGISINVIVVGMVDGLVRLYSSWDLSRVKEFRVSGLCSPISSIMYTRDSQLMYIAYEDGQMVVLRTKRKGSFSMPKEWIL